MLLWVLPPTSSLESVAGTIDYLDTSYIIDLCCRFAKMGAIIWIEDAWYHQLQREGDTSFMKAFKSIQGVTRAILHHANSIHIFLGVVTIVDISNIHGTHGMGCYRATGSGSNLKWPFQPKQPKAFWATFHWCLRQTFCTTTSPHQPAS